MNRAIDLDLATTDLALTDLASIMLKHCLRRCIVYEQASGSCVADGISVG
jgi:hypothetical protein